MDLKKLNDEYLKLKGKLDNINNRIKKQMKKLKQQKVIRKLKKVI